MEMNDLILVSVDDHIVEPPNMFDQHIPAAYKDKAPKIVNHNGNDFWMYEGRRLPNIGLNAVAGRPADEYGMEPAAFDQMRKGCYDVKARIGDMNANGVLGSLNFPTFVGFAGALFLGAQDKEAAKVIVSAYNDWHIDEWCGSAPGRFIPAAIIPLWDIDAAVAEARRVAAKGCHTITFPDSPVAKGLPSIHSGYWDPLFTVMCDNKMVVSAHIGSGGAAPHASMDAPIDAWITTMPISIVNAAADWLFSSVFKRFPDLKIALSEGGIGWIPYFLERADFTYRHHHAWTNSNFGGQLPSELFAKNFITCFIEDAFGLKNTDSLPLNMLMWECDYPHSDCTWPESVENLWKGLQGKPDDVINAVTHLNAMREFSYDPFSLFERDSCTVGALVGADCTVAALRARAKDVDTSKVSLGGINPSRNDGKPVTSGQIMKLFTDAA